MKVKTWYMSEFPSDSLGKEIKGNITFLSSWNRMKKGENIYTIIGVGDSSIREKIFIKMSEELNIPLETIYECWYSS